MLKCRILSGIDMTNDRSDYRGDPLDFISGLADVAGGLGEWIANGTPDSDSIAGEIQQRYRDHCDAWSNGPTWVQQIDPGARLFLSNACKPWLESQGSGDPVSTPGSVAEQLDGVDLSPYGGARIRIVRDFSYDLEESVIRWEINTDLGFEAVRRFNCSGSDIGNSSFTAIEIIQWGVCGGATEPPPGPPPPVIGPNPNPRPDPGLDPDDEPFERRPGQPVLPMPGIPDPFGDPVQLPNMPLPRIDGPSLFPEDEPPLAGPGSPGSPENIAGDEEAEGEADEDEILTGILIEVDSAPGFARTVQNVSEPTYVGACYVYLGWEDQLDLQPEGQFLVSGQFFAAVPGMTHWLVRSAVGYTLTITPYYAPRDGS